MSVALAMTHHDPPGRLYEQLVRNLPTLTRLFSGLTLRTTYNSHQPSLQCLADVGAIIDKETADDAAHGPQHGKARRVAVTHALTFQVDYVMYSDCDRVLHWAERYPDELAQVVNTLPSYDFTVLGRTLRAFNTHPRIQRDTEGIINHVFAQVSGYHFDIDGAARGLSRRAAQAIIEGCPDDSIGVDASWPLFMQRAGGFSIGYIETEGLEYETADRFPDEIAQAGGLSQWMARLDADPGQWAQRLDLARIEVDSMRLYAGNHAATPKLG